MLNRKIFSSQGAQDHEPPSLAPMMRQGPWVKVLVGMGLNGVDTSGRRRKTNSAPWLVLVTMAFLLKLQISTRPDPRHAEGLAAHEDYHSYHLLGSYSEALPGPPKYAK